MSAAGWEPEPYVDGEWNGETIPVAQSWLAQAQPVHHELVAEMLLALPGRRLTRITGHGDRTDSWMAHNEGPDGCGSWVIPHNPRGLTMDDDEYARTMGDGSAATNLREWASPDGAGHGTAAAACARAVLFELERLRVIEDRAQRVVAHVPDPDFVKAARFILDGHAGKWTQDS